jgi:hypothetical protein
MTKALKAQRAPLDAAFEDLQKLLLRYAPPFKTSRGAVDGKKDLHLKIPRAVVVPGAYGGKPVEVAMASLILQKGYVGFYFNMSPEIKRELSPALLELLKGKTCFHVRRLNADLLNDIEAALTKGLKCYKERGWV